QDDHQTDAPFQSDESFSHISPPHDDSEKTTLKDANIVVKSFFTLMLFLFDEISQLYLRKA
ncbi:hypothetical protein ACFL9U_14490, partial [Thermodesulfobacteriota bacterium]